MILLFYLHIYCFGLTEVETVKWLTFFGMHSYYGYTVALKLIPYVE